MAKSLTRHREPEVSRVRPNGPQEITDLLRHWNQGHQSALDQLMPAVYDELRQLARAHLRRELPHHTLQPTALVNEIYMRLVRRKKVHWDHRAQFFGCAAQLMRRVLVDHARAKKTGKRLGDARFAFEGFVGLRWQHDVDLVALDDALNDLAQVAPRQSRIVELRYFAGLTIEETAEILEVGTATVIRDWSMAKAWLYQQLRKR